VVHLPREGGRGVIAENIRSAGVEKLIVRGETMAWPLEKLHG